MDTLLPIAPQPIITPPAPQPAGSNPVGFKWPLIAIFSFILGVAAVLAYQRYLPTRSVLVGASPSPAAVLPSPSTIVLPLSSINASPLLKETSVEVSNWKLYSNQSLKISFKYPQTWQILETRNDYVRIVADKINQLGDFIAVEIQTGKTLEQAKDYAVHYYAFSTAGLADQKPKTVSEKEITFNNFDAFQYVYLLTQPYSTKSDTVYQILIPRQTGIVDIKLQSSDKNFVDLILSTFKFSN